MRALGDVPKTVLVLEAIGMLLLVIAYLSINGYVTLPGWLATPTAAITLVFCGIGMMVPATVVLISRVAHGGIQLLDGSLQTTRSSKEKKIQTQHKDSKYDTDH